MMTKRKSATRKTGRTQLASKAKPSRKNYRSAIVGAVDTLPIVEGEFGRALNWT